MRAEQWRRDNDKVIAIEQAYAVMLVSHCGEYPCECKKIYSRQIRQILANI